MDAPAIPLHEFDAEMATTRRVLARVPSAQGPWKPHAKSFALGHLAQLVAEMPGWITRTLTDGAFDLADGPAYAFQPTEGLLAVFDQHVAAAREALHARIGAALEDPWSLRSGDRVLMTLPRGVAARQQLNHLIHHRGQLSVYLRLLDVPVPSIYGPSADEPWSP